MAAGAIMDKRDKREHPELKQFYFKMAQAAADKDSMTSAQEVEIFSEQLRPYKQNHAWPGRTYRLVGNSYNVEVKIVDTASDTKRSACIAMVLEKGRNNRNCVSVADALKLKI